MPPAAAYGVLGGLFARIETCDSRIETCDSRVSSLRANTPARVGYRPAADTQAKWHDSVIINLYG